MFKSYKLLTLLVNLSGGESETIEHLYKEVDGESVPCTEEESYLKLYDKMSKVGGNPQIQAIKTILINPRGVIIREDLLVKPTEVSAE